MKKQNKTKKNISFEYKIAKKGEKNTLRKKEVNS